MTQADLADRLREAGISLDRAAIAKIETGRRGVQDFELLAIAKVFGVSPSQILGAESLPEAGESAADRRPIPRDFVD